MLIKTKGLRLSGILGDDGFGRISHDRDKRKSG